MIQSLNSIFKTKRRFFKTRSQSHQQRLKLQEGSACLLIGEKGATLALRLKDRWHEPVLVSNDEHGRQFVIELLKKHPETQLSVVFDTVDQSYRKETIPKGSSAQAKKILDRRLRFAFPDTKLRILVRHRSQISGSERLLVALSESTTNRGWLNDLNDADIVIRGVGLLPLEFAVQAQAINRFSSMNIKEGWHLINMRQKTGGIRQIVLHDGALVLSRLIEDSNENLDSAAFVGNINNEIQATITYLLRLGCQSKEDIHLHVVSTEHQENAFGDFINCISFGYLLSLEQLAGQYPNINNFCDFTIAAWIAHQGIVEKLPVESSKKASIDLLIAQCGVASMAASLLLFAGSTSYFAYEYFHYYSETKSSQRQLLSLQSENDQIASSKTGSEINFTFITDVINLNEFFKKEHEDFVNSLNFLQSILAEEIRLSEMRYTAKLEEQRREGPKNILEISLNLSRVPDISSALDIIFMLEAEIKKEFEESNIVIKNLPANLLPNESISVDADNRLSAQRLVEDKAIFTISW